MSHLQSTTISMSQVRKAIRASARSVNDLCSHPHVNKWSGHQPTVDTRYPSSWVTEQNLNTASPYRLTLKYQKVYPKPYAEASPCRLGDFRNYYHEAQPAGFTSWKGLPDPLPASMGSRDATVTYHYWTGDIDMRIYGMNYLIIVPYLNEIPLLTEAAFIPLSDITLNQDIEAGFGISIPTGTAGNQEVILRAFYGTEDLIAADRLLMLTNRENTSELKKVIRIY